MVGGHGCAGFRLPTGDPVVNGAVDEGSVRVVARPETSRGFRLAGLPVRPATDGPGAEEVTRRLASQDDVAVIFVQRELFDGLGEGLRRSLEATSVPVVVPFPDPSWEEAGPSEEWVVELLRRAVGYRVQLR